MGGITHAYYYAGGKLLRETYGGNTLDFFYDAGGAPYALKYNGTVYYYITNLQGDVMKLVNSSGAVVVGYTYDAWGNILSTTGSMANTLGAANPLRYRGYVYDTETHLYYLQSRYYDPAIGRFINADTFASTGQGIIGHNMFAYCGNYPTTNADFAGERIISFAFTASGVFGMGVSFSAGIAMDTEGGCELQYSYVFPGANNTNTIGVIGAGIGASLQLTDAETVSDLHGNATYIGASVGPGWYLGGDLMSFDDASSREIRMNGVQFSAGIDVGIDIHVEESYTATAPNLKAVDKYLRNRLKTSYH